MILSQVEIAQELINNNDATIQGILLAFIAILLIYIGFMHKERKEDKAYIRDQDKANLEMLLNVTNIVKDVGDISSKNGDKLDVVQTTATGILGIIKERLKPRI